MPEGVVGALHAIHRALRPDGLLLDLHPEPEVATVAIWTGTRCLPIDPLVNSSSRIANTHGARATLSRLIAAGYFAREAEEVFPFLSHFPSIDAWQAFRIARGTTADFDDRAVERARRLLQQHGGTLRIREIIRACRLRRLPR